MDASPDRIPRAAALCVIAIGAAWVAWTCLGLPDPVASHFSASGAADGWIPRGAFRASMFALGAGLPVILLFWLRSLKSNPSPSVPRRGAWSAPRARDARAIGPWAAASFSVAFAALMDFVASRAACANLAPPPSFSPSEAMGAIAAFAAFLVAWGLAVSIGRR